MGETGISLPPPTTIIVQAPEYEPQRGGALRFPEYGHDNKTSRGGENAISKGGNKGIRKFQGWPRGHGNREVIQKRGEYFEQYQ